jgi:uncharacterized OB-fold protein
MSEPTRPLPRIDEADTAEFWRRTRNLALCFQQCDDCGAVVFYPRSHCTGCLGANLSWHESKGEGQIYTFSIVRQSYHPFFRTKVPYAIGWVDLDEGPRILTNFTGVNDPDELRIGQRVVVEWETHEDLSIPLFRPF